MDTDQGKDTAAEVADLTAKNVTLAERKAEVEKRLRALCEAEDLKAGVYFAQEIFTAKQERLTIATEIEINRCRINRLTRTF